MKTKLYFITVLTAYLFTACHGTTNHQVAASANKQEQPSYFAVLKAEKKHIEALMADTNNIIVLAKLSNSDDLKIVKNGNFPDETETSYNIVKNDNGNIVSIVESPTSESGDWNITYTSYFDKRENLFAFDWFTGFFNSGCTEDAAHETVTKYYDNKFKVIDSTYVLTDSKEKPLNKASCVFNYNYPYKVIYDLKSYLTAKKINIR